LQPLLLPSGPVARFASVVGERDDTDFSAANVIDDTVGKLPYRKTAPIISPRRSQLWMGTKKFEHSFVFGNKRESNFGVAFAGVEKGSFG
jgi:hypothetical protein